MNDMLHINFRAPATVKDSFYSRCERNGEVPANVLRRLMAAYAAGKIDTQPKGSIK